MSCLFIFSSSFLFRRQARLLSLSVSWLLDWQQGMMDRSGMSRICILSQNPSAAKNAENKNHKSAWSIWATIPVFSVSDHMTKLLWKLGRHLEALYFPRTSEIPDILCFICHFISTLCQLGRISHFKFWQEWKTRVKNFRNSCDTNWAKAFH